MKLFLSSKFSSDSEINLVTSVSYHDIMVLFFFFCECVELDYKYSVTGDWSQSIVSSTLRVNIIPLKIDLLSLQLCLL